MVRESAEILQEMIEDEQNLVPLRYYNVERGKEETIISCHGDLMQSGYNSPRLAA